MYALVQWCGGSDNGKRSVVNTKKIRNFDETKFVDGEITRGDEFAVEWGTGRAPKGGFPTYMAKVLKIADKESTLSACNPSVMEDSDEFISEEDNEEDDRPSKRQSIPKMLCFDDHPTKDAPTKVALVNRNNNKDKAAAKQLQNQQIAASLSQRQGSEKDKATEELQLLRHELQELRNFVFSELPKISQQVQEMTARPAPAPASETPLSPQYVEIYPGSGVMAPKNVYRAAMQANTGTAMARILLLGVFDIEILATSNLRGGEAKVGGKGEARQALDGVKMKAIFDAVMDRHPATTRGAIGTAVNCKLAEIRAHLAKSRRSEGRQRKMRNGDSSDSDDSYQDRKRKSKKKHKKHWSSDSSDDDWKKSKSKKPSSFGKRVLSPEDVVHRYKVVLKVFRRNRSMTNTCEELGVDRNTIAGTAVIADVMIATEGADFGELPLFKEKQTLANYAKLCKAFVDANKSLQEKIEKMRKATELLPIKYKMPK